MKELADLTDPFEITKPKMLEAEVQDICVRWMRGRGYWARKFSSISQRSVPDYLFAKEFETPRFHLVRLKMATEFKKEGHKVDKVTGLMSTEAQIEEQEAMRLAGWIVFESSDVDLFKATVLEQERNNGC